MCNLAATGINDLATVLLLVGAVALVAVGAVLMLKRRGARGAFLALLLVVGGVGVGSVTGSAPAQAASCAASDAQGGASEPSSPGDDSTGSSIIAVDSVSWVASGLSDNKTFVVTNTSATIGAANVLATITGGDATFSVTGTTCPALLAPGASCAITIAFATVSTSFGAFSSAVSFAGNNTNTIAATLSGTGYTTLEISPLTDGVYGGGPASILTVTNSGTVDALDFEATIVVPPRSGFIVADSDCSAVTRLAPGASCTVEITFSGSIGGNLTVTPTASNAPVSSTATVQAYLG